MSSGLLTRQEVAQVGQVSLRAVDKAMEERVLRPQRTGGRTLLRIDDVGTLTLLNQVRVPLPVAVKRRIGQWGTQRPMAEGAAFPISKALVLFATREVLEAEHRASEYVRLRDQYIQSDPEILGGEPVIRGTRMPVAPWHD